MILNLLDWLAADPFRYLVVAFTPLSITIGLALAGERRSFPRGFEIFFLASIAATLFAWRWPSFLYLGRLNPDEGLWVAGALKATTDLVPWRGFDGTTSGPINSYVLALPALFHLPIDFVSTRVIGCIVLIITLWSLYYAVKWVYDAGTARLSVLPAMLFLALTTEGDFVQFSSEYVPVCLTTIALAATSFIASAIGSRKARIAACLLAGFCVGSTPFAKLQAIPIAFVVLIFLIMAIWTSPRQTGINRRMLTLYTGAGLVAIPALFLGSICFFGDWNDALTSYVRASLAYVSSQPQPAAFHYFFEVSRSYGIFVTCSLICILAGGVWLGWKRHFSLRLGVLAAASLLLLIVGIFVVRHPHREFPHYLLFSVVPISVCLATVLHLARQVDVWNKGEHIIAFVYVSLFLVPAIGLVIAEGPNRFLRNVHSNLKKPRSLVGTAISHYAPPGSRIAVWGWAPEYYVETATIMATRDAQTTQQIWEGPYFSYFRKRYMSDLLAHPPRIFVEAVAPEQFRHRDRKTDGLECFPELAQFVRERYTLRDEVQGVRIFLANSP
jgi:hypothetical protein